MTSTSPAAAGTTPPAHPAAPPAASTASVDDPRIDSVLTFWLGAATPTDASALALQKLWFTKSNAVDDDIRLRFGTLIGQARAGQLQAWEHTPLGRLALVLVLDQFSRNAFRGLSASFAADAQVLALAEQGLANGHADALPLVARAFMALPLEHAEDLARQERSVALLTHWTAQAASAEPGVQKVLAGMLDYAHQHHDVIARFGRFPHRNAILGRASTVEEQAYLAKPGAGF